MSTGDGASGEASASSSSLSSPPSSRILVLSPSPQQVPLSSLEHLVRSITSSSSSNDNEANDFDADGDADGADAKQVAWTISNRYYEADVHFRLLALDLDVGVGGKASRNRRPPRRLAANGGGGDGQQSKEEAAPSPAEQLRAELQGVPAIILVMPGGQHVAAHDRVLACLQEAATPPAAADATEPQEDEEDDTAMPMGFELGASVVVCLPRVLQQATGMDTDTGSHIAESDEQLRDLYAEHGWEFVDLARDLGVAEEEEGGKSDDGNEQRLGEGDGDDEEEDGQGFRRVREALEAHMWPGLRRKATTRGVGAAASRPDAQQGQGSAASGIDEALRRVDLDSEQQRGLLSGSRDPIMGTGVGATSTHLPNIAANGSSSSSNGARSAPLNLVDVQPTAEDEELARKFLAQIDQFERESGGLAGGDDGLGSSTAPETEEARQAKQEEALRRLEEFLESEDATWGRPRESGHEDEDDDENALAAAAAHGLHFEDDFDDFVNAAPLGRHDDANDSGAAASAFAGIDLEGSLQQLRHEAQRVRGMPGDQEAKEREAEDVVKKMLERWQLDD